MELSDLWTPRLEIKRTNAKPYPECDLLIVIATCSHRCDECVPELLEKILDVSDPHGICLAGDFVWSREHKAGGLVDVQVWPSAGVWSKNKIRAQLVGRPPCIILLLADVNNDDPLVVKNLQQSVAPLPSAQVLVLSVMPKVFPSSREPDYFHISFSGLWHSTLSTGDEVKLMDHLRERIDQTLAIQAQFTASSASGLQHRIKCLKIQTIESGSQNMFSSSESSTLDSSVYVPAPLCSERQVEMNSRAFTKYAQQKT